MWNAATRRQSTKANTHWLMAPSPIWARCSTPVRRASFWSADRCWPVIRIANGTDRRRDVSQCYVRSLTSCLMDTLDCRSKALDSVAEHTTAVCRASSCTAQTTVCSAVCKATGLARYRPVERSKQLLPQQAPRQPAQYRRQSPST